ncbi:MSHA biogenesis protein MshJ [Janthinobacterium sp. 17J80-10]|uniref:MSHA biogenesis protein MshJ n=1 Tax=Janthinobacterium sp. 17J80-10 TaxID=2497863 RepID=UPI00100579FE|nr:MSHA biogenesis protein MshJ [Janthinobacterium sp. 17J80-10]QAU34280.1 MSHA biogenesis protein MshJ [Janthinobacterium sp. 17J80-10]
MMPQLQKLAQKINALSLRERVIVFVTIAVALLFLVNRFLLEPQFLRQQQLAEQLSQDQARMKEIQSSIQQKIKAREVDPDATDRVRLQALQHRFAQMQSSLLDLQKGLVSPERMSSLLEDILKRNGKLRLIALKTLPVTTVADSTASQSEVKNASATALSPVAASKTAPTAADAIFKHGVEITVQGSYPDMLRYMSDLESMPWQLFWGKAKLQVDEYPQATLTLTLFTLSLDRKWLNL